MWLIKLILVAVTIEGITTLPVAVEQLSKSNVDRHNACSLIFNVGKTPEGQQTVTSIKMPSLRAILSKEETEMMRNICNLVFAVQPTVAIAANANKITTTISPNKDSSTQSPVTTSHHVTAKPHEENKDSELGRPIYELQITAWPTEVDDISDAVQSALPLYEEQDVIFPEEEAVLAQAAESDEPTVIPLYEDQLVIFPEISFEEDNLNIPDDGVSLDETLDVVPITPVEPVEVLESYHTVHPNGTTEYKLVLSNGLVNYKKIYSKLVNGEVITVQEGYDSVPIPGRIDEFQTQFYIADENGNNVYKAEHNHRKPVLPIFLSYTEQKKITNER